MTTDPETTTKTTITTCPHDDGYQHQYFFNGNVENVVATKKTKQKAAETYVYINL